MHTKSEVALCALRFLGVFFGLCFRERKHCLSAIGAAIRANLVAQVLRFALYAFGKARAIKCMVRTAICRVCAGVSHSYYHSFLSIAGKP